MKVEDFLARGEKVTIYDLKGERIIEGEYQGDTPNCWVIKTYKKAIEFFPKVNFILSYDFGGKDEV